MKSHIAIPKSKGYKNKRIAQNVGIAVAKTTFKMMLDSGMRGFMFSWENPDLLNRAADDLFIYYPRDWRKPKNMEELKLIADQATRIEFENLKESYDGELPVHVYSDLEIIEKITSIVTDKFLSLKSVDFYHENSKVVDIDNIWKDLFVEHYTVADLLALSKSRANEIFEKKDVSEANREIVLRNIDSFWNNITDLKSKLYSSH